MPGIHRLKHIDRLRAAHFADNDPVRPHAQRCADQFPDRNGTDSFHIGLARLHSYQIGDVPQLQFGIILDRNHPLTVRNKL